MKLLDSSNQFRQTQPHVMIVAFYDAAKTPHRFTDDIYRQSLFPFINITFLGGVAGLNTPLDRRLVFCNVHADTLQLTQKTITTVGNSELEKKSIGRIAPLLRHRKSRRLAMRPHVVQQITNQFANAGYKLSVLRLAKKTAYALVNFAYRTVSFLPTFKQYQRTVIFPRTSSGIRICICLSKCTFDRDGFCIIQYISIMNIEVLQA